MDEFHHAPALEPIGLGLWARWTIRVNFAMTGFSKVRSCLAKNSKDMEKTLASLNIHRGFIAMC
jgi:hypothetical protein